MTRGVLNKFIVTRENGVVGFFNIKKFQSRHKLPVTSHINCIVARCLINSVYLSACAFISGHDDVALLNDVANGTESTQTSKIT